jgi:hypothetical protein
MVDFTDMLRLPFVHPGPVYSRNTYDQVHETIVVNANAFFRRGAAVPSD